MAPRKIVAPKKPPVRKRRANTLLTSDNKRPSSSQAAAARGAVTMNVPATSTSKAPSLKLIMRSRSTTTPSLRLNEPKPPKRQRPEPVTESLLNLLKPSSPTLPESQLPESLDSIPPPDVPSSRRRPVDRGSGATFSQMLANESLSFMGRSESPCSFRSSQSGFAARMRASTATQPNSQLNSQFDSQATYDDEEDREERRREQETLLTTETRNSQPPRPQKKDKESARPKAKTKPSQPPASQKDVVEVDSPSEEEAEVIQYKLNVESFWEGEKIAFNTEIERHQLGVTPSVYVLSAAQDSKAREHASSIGHILCHRVSLVATPTHDSLAATKQKHFSVQKTDPGEYAQVLNTVLDELLDWKQKKELQLGLIYRYARNKSGVIEKKPAATKTIPAIITQSGRTLGNRSISLTDIPTSSNPIERLLNAQAVKDEINPVVAVRREIRACWKCLKKDCDSQEYPEPVCYINDTKDPRRHYLVTPQDLTSWSAAILANRTNRLTVEAPPMSLAIAWERNLKNKQKVEARKRRNEREDNITRPRDYAPPAATPATTIIQLPTSSTNSTDSLTDIRSSRLEAELAARGHYDPQRSVSRAYDPQRSVSRAYSRGVTVTPVTSAPEQRASSPVHVDLEEFIEDMKLEATPHDQRALENAKNTLLDKHYKSQHIQKWKGDDFEHKWEKLGIEPGIGRELADNVGAFGRRKKSARSLPVLLVLPCIPISTPVLNSIENGSYDRGQQEEDGFEGELDLDETLYDDDEEYI